VAPVSWTILINALKISEPLTFCHEPVPLSDQDVKERLEREILVSLDNSDDVILWLKRANRYFPHIEKVLKNNSLPDDLKYIVIAESSLKPLATSNKGAVGFWQFIENTGVKYGMKSIMILMNGAIFLLLRSSNSLPQDLYALFGSWTLLQPLITWARKV